MAGRRSRAAEYLACRYHLDRAAALLCLLALIPFGLLVALLIRLDGPGPVIYRQERVGRSRGGRCRLFVLLKFRTMVPDAERATGPVWASPDDPRATRIGRFLRRWHIDELPQLWNVVRGEMALIGPRPERPHFVRLLSAQLPGYQERHLPLPGLTGLAQCKLGEDHCLADVREKLRLDRFYVRYASPGLDLAILVWTVGAVARGGLTRAAAVWRPWARALQSAGAVGTLPTP